MGAGMTAIDGGLRPMFRTRLPGHWQAIETGGTGLGIPDSSFCIQGVEGWVEFKVTDTRKVPLRPEQVGWHMVRGRHGGWTFVAVRHKHEGGPRKGEPVDELWMLAGRYAMDIKEHGLDLKQPYVLGVWSGGPSKWDWTHVQLILTAKVARA